MTEIRQFEDRGYSLTIDHGWREVVDSVRRWVKENGLSRGKASPSKRWATRP